MSLLHPALLFGLGLAVIPILLHLLLRAKPKRLIFPALRLIQQSRRQNVRRLQLRHLWLLLLRMLVIGLIALALTRPSLPAANYSLVWREWATLFAVIAIGLCGYFAVIGWWKRREWPRQKLLTRRTMLRGGIGLGTVALLLLCVGWPYARRVAAEIKSPAKRVVDNIPVAAVFLFDTSPSMSYRQGNQTRLQFAQQIARDHLSRLPAGSKVAVTGSHESTTPAFTLDLQSARSKIDAHEIKAGGLTLNDRLRTVLLAQEEDRRRVTEEQGGPEEKRQDRYLREIYLFTDLTRAAWREESSTLLRDELKRLEFVSIYLIDVGETDPTNVGITSVKLARETVPVGGTLKMDVVMSATGNVKTDQTVEVLLRGADGKLNKQGQKPVTIEPNTEQRLTFEIPNIAGRYQQGEIRIVGSDPMTIDDVGYFTVQTMPSLKVLIVAETESAARYWRSTLEYIAKENMTAFVPEFLITSRLGSTELKPYDVVCLINVAALDGATWTKLRNYVDAGGGLGVFLGAENALTSANRRGINPDSYDSKEAQTILPVKLKARLAFSSPQTMDLRDSQHAFLRRLDDLNALPELGAIEIFRYWLVEPQEVGIVVAKYTDSRASPALVERRLGQGRVMLMTTSVDNLDWNDLRRNPWTLAFADLLMQYLLCQASMHCNFQVGNEVSLPLDRERKLKKVVLRMPDFKQGTHDIAADSTSLLIRDLTTIGSYQVDSAEGEVDYHSGFSLNLPARESNLARMEPHDLDSLLGEGRYTVNRDPSSLERTVQTGRLGQEVYSTIVAFLVAVFSLEQFTAAWFYRTDEV